MISSNNKIRKNANENWFIFILIYFIIDYGRPQDIIHIGFLKIGLIANIILMFFIIRNGNIKQAIKNQSKMIILFIMLLAAYIPFAKNNFFAYSVTRAMLLYLPVILSIILCVNTLERLKVLIFSLIILMIYIAIWGIKNKGVGSGSYFSDENDLSLFINMWIPFCYFLIPVEKNFYKRIIYIFGCALGIIANVLSFSRGGFLGMLAIACACWLYSKKKVRALLIIILIGFSIYIFAGQKYLSEVDSVTDTNEGTARARIESWKSGWRMFIDHPLGVGGNNFPVWFPYYQTKWFNRGMWGRVAHSLWFTLIPELGIFGIIIYSRLMYYNFKDIYFIQRHKSEQSTELNYLKALSYAFFASSCGYFSSGTFLSVLYYPHYWYLAALIMSAKKITVEYESNISKENEKAIE